MTALEKRYPDGMPCPAHTDGRVCMRPYGDELCIMFKCKGCKRDVPACFGGDDSELCNDCWWAELEHDPTNFLLEERRDG